MNFRTREAALTAFQYEVFDLAIVGGGITGAGIARDAASRGMKVALIEASDFASGTSSRSSKLIHGGIRYLENMEFGLVFEALSERRLLFEIAPHLVHPLRFALPVYKHSRVGMFKMGLGMWLYDALACFEAPELHERLNARETLKAYPWLKAEDLLGSFVYSDGYMEDDRLVLETLRSAQAYGAQVANYVRMDESQLSSEHKITSLKITDILTSRPHSLKARHYVSATGPWTDRSGTKLVSKWQNRMRPTKGIHLTFARERFPLEQAVVMALEGEDRIVFGIPREEMVIVGTTDTDFREDPAQVRSLKDDVSYLLKVANQFFPKAHLTETDVLASYSGVRPLVQDSADSESKTSREHVIFTEPSGLTVVTGGKYTTYRNMAEQTVKECLRYFSLEDRVRFKNSQTKAPLSEAATPDTLQRAMTMAEDWGRAFGVSRSTVETAIRRHGLEALEILKRMKSWQTYPGNEDTHYWMAQADFAIDTTLCLNPIDFFVRRTPLVLCRADHGLSLAPAIAKVFSTKLPALNSGEVVAALNQYLKFEMGWREGH